MTFKVGQFFKCKTGELLFINHIGDSEIQCNVRGLDGEWLDEMLCGPRDNFEGFLQANQYVKCKMMEVENVLV